MAVLKGDFIGFTYNGIHSSELGIMRTSDGSRFNENLLPTFTDKTAIASGVNETYYFGSQYTQKQFSISVAFDSLTEVQFRKIRQIFGDQKIHDLIFDELPFKIYSAKVSGTPTWKYVCFDDENGERVYKGEGSIQFICYYPFARSRYKYLNNYTIDSIPEWKVINSSDTTYPLGDAALANSIYDINEQNMLINIDEWKNSSGMDRQASVDINGRVYLLDTFIKHSFPSGGGIFYDCYIKNCGDIPTDFKLLVPVGLAGENTQEYDLVSFRASLFDREEKLIDTFEIKVDNIVVPKNSSGTNDSSQYLQVNSKLNILEGVTLLGYKKVTISETEFNEAKYRYFIYEEQNDKYFNCATIVGFQIYNPNTIYYVRQFETNERLYNQYISGGRFFKIPVGEYILRIENLNIKIDNTDDYNFNIEYDYLYF